MIIDGVEPMERLFVGEGHIPHLCRTVDWSATTLGEVAGWPSGLQTVVRTCLDAANVPMAIWAGQDLTLIYNQGYAEFLGGSMHPRALGRPAREVWPESWPQLGPQLKRVMDRGECIQFEGALFPLACCAGDEAEFMSYSFVPVRDDRGDVIAALNVIHAAQKCVAAANALVESEERFRMLANNIPQLAWMADETGSIFWYNRRWYEYTGTTPEAMRGWGWHEVHHPDHVARVVLKIRKCFATGETWEDTFPLRARSGEYRWFLSRATPIRDAAGNITRWLGTNTDITEQQTAEEALRGADRHKTDFLAWLSHELRNPIGIITTSLALIDRAGIASAHAQRALPVINRQVKQVDRLLQDLLDIVRISKGKILLRRESVELNEIVRTAAEDHRPVFEHEGIGFDVKLASQPLRANVDRARIAQAVGNLLLNAAKFTPSGGHVILSLDAAENDTATIEVRDNGAGLAPEILDTVFEPLVQDARTIDRSRGGLGLGLALVKQLAELHGGTVSASSDVPGGGAVFTIRLPLE